MPPDRYNEIRLVRLFAVPLVIGSGPGCMVISCGCKNRAIYFDRIPKVLQPKIFVSGMLIVIVVGDWNSEQRHIVKLEWKSDDPVFRTSMDNPSAKRSREALPSRRKISLSLQQGPERNYVIVILGYLTFQGVTGKHSITG